MKRFSTIYESYIISILILIPAVTETPIDWAQSLHELDRARDRIV